MCSRLPYGAQFLPRADGWRPAPLPAHLRSSSRHGHVLAPAWPRTHVRRMASLLHTRGEQQPDLARARQRCRRKFLKFFPRGFADPKYQAWERDYKWEAHEAWEKALGRTGL